MVKINIICIGKIKEGFFADAAKEYIKRLEAYCRLTIEEIPETRVTPNAHEGDIEAALAKEAAALELRLPGRGKQGLTAAMCVEGKQLGSEQFSKLLKTCESVGKTPIYFIIGGSNGLHPRVKEQADLLISASEMTFPHHLFRVMLLEQIYRAYKIAEGSKYHK
ncbi:MAG: 23S rRNA (pseudouridine(1915)-N(3))-methyltransferase RlmH [Oscillospiraceae bacterium]|jgi:23S rRNA (pseudouridine1915-N3)-methyltransferase|nr:23S rRNA (pseudouridine(1915)-N(3))-methyltransferase RlmH [Oscillospiraceae bacterium]MDR2360326.1 23S rRNA (pseudouridine(1915)-N(3))-methyltransferase RlmH [Oscillospiraceae bacterium]